MQTPPAISYHNLEPSPAINALINKRLAALAHFHDRITGCDIALEALQKRKLHGRSVRARLLVRLPGGDIAVARDVAQGSAQDDLMLAVNRAFTAAEKRLKQRKKIQAAVEVKHHPPVLHGEITLIEPELGHGWLRADDGREVYFQRDSLTADDWDRLQRGRRLRFREMEGQKGPYAINLTLMD